MIARRPTWWFIHNRPFPDRLLISLAVLPLATVSSPSKRNALKHSLVATFARRCDSQWTPTIHALASVATKRKCCNLQLKIVHGVRAETGNEDKILRSAKLIRVVISVIVKTVIAKLRERPTCRASRQPFPHSPPCRPATLPALPPCPPCHPARPLEIGTQPCDISLPLYCTR